MKESTRNADTVLASWGRFVRAGGTIGGLGYPSMTTLARLVCPSRIQPDDHVMEEIDIQKSYPQALCRRAQAKWVLPCDENAGDESQERKDEFE